MKIQNRAKESVLRYIAIYYFFELWNFLIPTSECLFLLVRRHYREAINYLLLLTWQHIIGWILHTDDITWNVSIYKKKKKRERSFRFTLLVAFGTCSQVPLQKVPRDPFKVTSAFIFIVITIFPMNYFFIPQLTYKFQHPVGALCVSLQFRRASLPGYWQAKPLASMLEHIYQV